MENKTLEMAVSAVSTMPVSVTRFMERDVCVLTEVHGLPAHINSVFSGVFVLTLTDCWDRHMWLTHTMAAIHGQYTVCFMKRPPIAIYNAYKEWALSNAHKYLLSIGELGCVASHVYILNLARKLDNDCSLSLTGKVVVFEDDIMLHKEFNTHLQALVDRALDAIRACHVLLLGASDWAGEYKRRVMKPNNWYTPSIGKKMCGTFAYGVTPAFAAVLARDLKQAQAPADHFFPTQIEGDTIVCFPFLALPDRTTSTIRDGFVPGQDKDIEYHQKCLQGTDEAAYNRICTIGAGDADVCARIADTIRHPSSPSADEYVARIVRESTWGRDVWMSVLDTMCHTEMDMDMAICLATFNPCGFKNPTNNLKTVLCHLQHYPVFLVHLHYSSDVEAAPTPLLTPAELCGAHYRVVTTSTVLFHKENLWNVAESCVPARYSKLLFLDADIVFAEPAWYRTLSRLLDTATVVQPFRCVSMLDTTGSVVRILPSMIAGRQQSPKAWGAPGFGFACRRDWFRAMGGLFDGAIMGGGDLMQQAALDSSLIPFLHSHISWTGQPYAHEPWTEFCRRVCTVGVSCTYAPLSISHLYHGDAADRQYDTRHDQAKHFRLCDFRKNTDGVWDAVEDGVAKAVNDITLRYFRHRKEDGPSISTLARLPILPLSITSTPPSITMQRSRRKWTVVHNNTLTWSCVGGGGRDMEARPPVMCFIHSHRPAADPLVLQRLLQALRPKGWPTVVVNVGEPISAAEIKAWPQVTFTQYGTDPCVYECGTLNLVRQYGLAHPDHNILYMHTKGARVSGPCIRDWVSFMVHHLLQGPFPDADAAGCNLSAQPWPHFSGNFWWAKGAHVGALPPLNIIPPVDRMTAESWVLSCVKKCDITGSVTTIRELGASRINHYLCGFPKALYATGEFVFVPNVGLEPDTEWENVDTSLPIPKHVRAVTLQGERAIRYTLPLIPGPGLYIRQESNVS